MEYAGEAKDTGFTSTSEVMDIGHMAVVNFEPDPATYVTEAPLKFGSAEVFRSDLDPDQLRLLEFTPARMREYPTLDEFLAEERHSDYTRGTINFMRYFQRDDTVAAVTKKTSPSFRRLRVVAPELVADLESDIGFASEVPAGFADLDTPALEGLFKAYGIMRHLVSREEALRLSVTDGRPYYDSDLLIR